MVSSVSTPRSTTTRINRQERGKCRLQVERSKGKGYRTVRTTTNKHGRWVCTQEVDIQQHVVTVLMRSRCSGSHNVVALSVGIPTAQYRRHYRLLSGTANRRALLCIGHSEDDPPNGPDIATLTGYEATVNLARNMPGRSGLSKRRTSSGATSPEDADAWNDVDEEA